jgi:hypothetical protein
MPSLSGSSPYDYDWLLSSPPRLEVLPLLFLFSSVIWASSDSLSIAWLLIDSMNNIDGYVTFKKWCPKKYLYYFDNL